MLVTAAAGTSSLPAVVEGRAAATGAGGQLRLDVSQPHVTIRGMGYGGKVIEQARARVLQAEGLTLAQIAERLAVSKGSVSRWVRDVEVPRRPAMPAAPRPPNALQRRKIAEVERLHAEGRARIGRLNEREFLVAGAALYAGEGTKTDGDVAFTNTDPRLIMFHCAWIRRFFDVDEARLRVSVYLHADLDIAEATSWWAEVTGIPPSQFTRPHRAVVNRSMRRSRHVHGCASVRYSCAATHRAVMGLMDGVLLAPRDPG